MNIVIGHTISSFDKFFSQIKVQEDVLDFERSSINNSRKPTKNKAEKFIKKWDKIALPH